MYELLFNTEVILHVLELIDTVLWSGALVLLFTMMPRLDKVAFPFSRPLFS